MMVVRRQNAAVPVHVAFPLMLTVGGQGAVGMQIWSVTHAERPPLPTHLVDVMYDSQPD